MSIKTILYWIARIIVGAVFTFSGFVKAIDPWGFTYKIQDYLAAMGDAMTIFSDLAFAGAVVLSAIELVVGLCLIFGIRTKESSWIAALLMLFMTPLTLWIALENPVQDCGCFGDALIINNWTTFWKNVVLCIFIAYLLFQAKNFKSTISTQKQWLFVGYSLIFSIALSIYCYCYLPIIDFRPYHIGANIEEGMSIPDDAEQDIYDIKLIYERNGEQQIVSLEEYDQLDSTWQFVDQQTTLIKKGYEPPIHDFTIDTEEDGDITEEILADDNYTFIIVAYDLTLMNRSEEVMNQLRDLAEFADEQNYRCILLTASIPTDIEKFKEELDSDNVIFATTDKITLKTIVRDNPGVLLIKDATIFNKWCVNTLPEFEQPLESSEFATIANPHETQNVLLVILFYLFPIAIVMFFDKRKKKN